MEQLELMVRLWELNGRLAQDRLSMDEQVELLALLRLVADELGIPEAGPLVKQPDSLRGELIGFGGVRDVEIQAVSPAAVFVTSAHRLDVASGFILQTADAIKGVEYTIPCRVAWAYESARFSYALVVDGIPRRTAFLSQGKIAIGRVFASWSSKAQLG